ncbi:cystatin-A-like [Mizuhopecten yessoensis]|uniref:Cystatin-A n=1 Tax=Mizuhopecten yessoensis TaxID=6573 RepID=A0A210QHS7_MIZYE|nr:cystatin-A-like [Mizuhopecten yessoensis]OWF48259.1 Cystatin-A [Mizuhopecten yessoensis]
MAAPWRNVVPATEDVIDITANLQPATGIFLDAGDFEMFESISSIKQVVQGTNYVIKVRISPEDTGYIHMKTYVALPINNQGPVITGIQQNKTLNDPIESFN